MLRIGFDLRPAQGPSADRGIGRYTRSLLQAMASHAPAGVEWTVIAWADHLIPWLPPGGQIATIADSSQALVRGVRRIGKTGPAMLLHRALDRRALAQIVRRERLDALLFPALFERDFFAADGVGCATVKVCHDLAPHFSGEAYGQGGIYAQMYRAEMHALAQADAVIAISEATRQDVLALTRCDPARVMVIRQGIDPVFQEPPPAESQAVQDRFCPDADYFLASGGLSENKNLETVVDALAILRRGRGPETRVLALGAPPEINHPRRAQIEQRAKQHGLKVGRDLIFLPFVDDRTLAGLYAASIALVFPSRFEGFGLPPAECMACGAPVIVSRTTSLPEVAGDAGLLVDPDDATAIAEAMGRLRDDASFRQERIELGRQQAASFDWVSTAEQTWHLLDKVARTNT